MLGTVAAPAAVRTTPKRVRPPPAWNTSTQTRIIKPATTRNAVAFPPKTTTTATKASAVTEASGSKAQGQRPPTQRSKHRQSVPTASSHVPVKSAAAIEKGAPVMTHAKADAGKPTRKAAARDARRSVPAAIVSAPSRGFRELQRVEQQLQEENDRLQQAASKASGRVRALKQERDDLRATVDRLEQTLGEHEGKKLAELEKMKEEFESFKSEQESEMRLLRQSNEERESELETELESAKQRNRILEKSVESLGINAVTLESFSANDKDDVAITELETKLRDIAGNLDERAPLFTQNLAAAKQLLAAF